MLFFNTSISEMCVRYTVVQSYSKSRGAVQKRMFFERCLKWQCHEIFCIFNFINPTHLGPRLKLFLLNFRGDICEISDSAQANTARSFAVINFVCAGLSMPSQRIIKNIYIEKLFQQRSTFLNSFVKGQLVKKQNITTKTNLVHRQNVPRHKVPRTKRPET